MHPIQPTRQDVVQQAADGHNPLRGRFIGKNGAKVQQNIRVVLRFTKVPGRLDPGAGCVSNFPQFPVWLLQYQFAAMLFANTDM